MKLYILPVLVILGCEPPQTIQYCWYQCTYDGLEQSSDECDPTFRINKLCTAPTKRTATLGEFVSVIGYDPDIATEEHHSVKLMVSAYVQEIVGNDFVLSEPGRPGLLGAGVWSEEGELIGLVQGDHVDGRMWGRSVE